ncbi:MAG: LPS export ABC transporter periplasmic protein LptC [Selenomonadales bacterium]|nr:LPS export ABC transporter periplasmic protein LptC [Selenomonadales bacterium]
MNKKIMAVIALFAVLIGGFIWYISDEGPDITQKVKEQVPDRMMTYSGNALKEEKNGKLIWEVTAETMQIDLESNAIVMQDMKGAFYREDGTVTELTAKEASYDQKENIITMDGSIEAIQSDGGKLKADKARYDGKKKHLYCDGNVEVKKDGYLVTGDHMVADQTSGKIRVDGNAHAIQIGE